MALTVFYDANVLYPAPLRDFLMHLALTDLFRAKWSDMVHEEWIEFLMNYPGASLDELNPKRD